jgi:SAM-dependent methyltransferase
MLSTVIRRLSWLRRESRPFIPFRSSSQYWETRYVLGMASGAGSYGRLAQFKAEVLNGFVRKRGVTSVVEFGCGDGNQLALALYPSYLGLDVSKEAIRRCRDRFAADSSKRFAVLDAECQVPASAAELSLSLDVIYHLIEDHVFDAYMNQLFMAASRFVIVYSSNNGTLASGAIHVRHRCFSDWVQRQRPDWQLSSHVRNRYPFEPSAPAETSHADFYIYHKAESPDLADSIISG